MSPSKFSVPQVLRQHQLLITAFLSLSILLSGCTSDSNGAETSGAQTSSSAAQSSDSASNTETITIAATIFPVYDIARQIVGDRANVSLLLAPGESPHTFNMTPSIQKQINDSTIIFGIGEGLDEWIVDSDNFIILSSGIKLNGWENEDNHDDDHDDHGHDDEKHEDDDDHDDHGHDDEKHEDDDDHDDHGHSGANPHYWLAPLNGIQMANNITKELKKVDPANATYYEANLAKFTADMESVQIELVDLAEIVHDDAFITLHDAWSYFADAFNLNLVGSFEPAGAEEPSPRYLKKLADTVEEHDVHAIFSEPQLSTASLEGFANDYDLEIAVLDPLGGVGSRDSYQALLRYNIQTFVDTLDHDH